MEGSKVENSQVGSCEIEDIEAGGNETENETEESHHIEGSNQMLQINPYFSCKIRHNIINRKHSPTTSFL